VSMLVRRLNVMNSTLVVKVVHRIRRPAPGGEAQRQPAVHGRQKLARRGRRCRRGQTTRGRCRRRNRSWRCWPRPARSRRQTHRTGRRSRTRGSVG
jgi:hypothetical protein